MGPTLSILSIKSWGKGGVASEDTTSSQACLGLESLGVSQYPSDSPHPAVLPIVHSFYCAPAPTVMANHPTGLLRSERGISTSHPPPQMPPVCKWSFLSSRVFFNLQQFSKRSSH